MNQLIGTTLIALGLVGAGLHVRSSTTKGKWVGTRREFEFVAGTLMALSLVPAGIMLITASAS